MVMIIVVVSGLIWLNFGFDLQVVFVIVLVIIILIIVCFCVLGLVILMLVMVGVGKVVEVGVLICNGEALQMAFKISVMILDKIGIIIQGVFKIIDILLVDGDCVRLFECEVL